MNYGMGFWVFVLDNGMPHAVEKCQFAPTINPVRNGIWVHCNVDAPTPQEQKSKILAEMSADYAAGHIPDPPPAKSASTGEEYWALKLAKAYASPYVTSVEDMSFEPQLALVNDFERAVLDGYRQGEQAARSRCDAEIAELRTALEEISEHKNYDRERLISVSSKSANVALAALAKVKP